MSSRRAMSMPPTAFEKPPRERNRCTSFLCVTWKVFTCILSHVTLITLVIAYCGGGAIMFQHFEQENEIKVRNGTSAYRKNLTSKLYTITYEDDELSYLRQENWTALAMREMMKFEQEILHAMSNGWDGREPDICIANNGTFECKPVEPNWNTWGSLFYSIIVITTIGYGDISPKTPKGKIATIFYAIIGIPLMLLCLSNIGDIMASSFRFIYWRVCCFACTREPKRRRNRRPPEFQRQQHSNRAQNSMRRSMRVSQKTTDSGVEVYYEPHLQHAHSDTELRYNVPDKSNWNSQRSNNSNPNPVNSRNRFSRHKNRDRFQERHTVERDRHVERGQRFSNEVTPRTRLGSEAASRGRPVSEAITRGRPGSHRFSRAQSMVKERTREPDSQPMKRTPHDPSKALDYSMTLPASYGRNKFRQIDHRAQSLDPRGRRDLETGDLSAPGVLCNKYAIDELMRESQPRDIHDQKHMRSKSMPRPQRRNSDLYAAPEVAEPRGHHKHLNNYQHRQFLSPPMDEDFVEMEVPVRKQSYRRREKERHPPSPRIMSPMGFAIHRQTRYDDESIYGMDGSDEYGDFYSDLPPRLRPVPIWLCVFLVISYILAGMVLFGQREGWEYLDAAYFCFITLTTIGFGDFVPKSTDQMSLLYCSLYLLFGIALLAMSFNLVQEEVIAHVKKIARNLGILKREETEY